MRYYIYKCNSRGPDYAPQYGDWNHVFERNKPTPWGRVTAHPEFGSLRAGVRLIAQQSDRNELVGVAEVVGFRGRGRDRVLMVRPIERLGVRIRPLKQADARIAAIPALQGGPIQTLYSITTSDAKYYLRAARAAKGSKPGTRSSHGGGGRRTATSPVRRILFARIGWMTFYAGRQPGDERPIGGGRYNINNDGHERFNFSRIDGRLYGYFQPPGSGPNLARIEPGWAQERLDDVLIVFVAANLVVGWYEDATLYANAQPPGRLRKQRSGCWYYCELLSRICG